MANNSYCNAQFATPYAGTPVPASNDIGETKTMYCSGATAVQVQCFPHNTNELPVLVGTPVTCATPGYSSWTDDFMYCQCKVTTPIPTPGTLNCWIDRVPDGAQMRPNAP